METIARLVALMNTPPPGESKVTLPDGIGYLDVIAVVMSQALDSCTANRIYGDV